MYSAASLNTKEVKICVHTCSMTSGAIQHGVPTNVWRTFSRDESLPAESHALTPKSAIITLPSSPSRILPAFMSLINNRHGGLIPWRPQIMNNITYTMMATAIKKRKTDGVLLRICQIHGEFTVILCFRKHVCGHHGLWPSLLKPNMVVLMQDKAKHFDAIGSATGKDVRLQKLT